MKPSSEVATSPDRPETETSHDAGEDAARLRRVPCPALYLDAAGCALAKHVPIASEADALARDPDRSRDTLRDLPRDVPVVCDPDGASDRPAA